MRIRVVLQELRYVGHNGFFIWLIYIHIWNNKKDGGGGGKYNNEDAEYIETNAALAAKLKQQTRANMRQGISIKIGWVIILPSGSRSLGIPNSDSAMLKASSRFSLLDLPFTLSKSTSSGRIAWITEWKATPLLQLRPKSLTSTPACLNQKQFCDNFFSLFLFIN